MTHPNEDRLIEFYLEIVGEEADRKELAAHLKVCEACREAFQHIKSDMDYVASFSLPPLRQHYPMPQKRAFYKLNWLKAAAILTLALFGSVSFLILNQTAPEVEPMKLEIKPLPDSIQIRLAFAPDELRSWSLPGATHLQ